MPTASALQLSLPFDTGNPQTGYPEVLREAPTLTWQRFSSGGPVRQWIVFPAFDERVPNLTGHLRRTLLVQFASGGLWLFRTTLAYRWPTDALERAAAACSQFQAGSGRNLRLLHQRLAESIDSPFEVRVPQLMQPGLDAWQLRAFAIDQIMGQMPTRGGPLSDGQLVAEADRRERVLTADLHTALTSFVAHLDRVALRLAHVDGEFSSAAFNALTGPNGQAQRYRRQFAEAFPLFANALLSTEGPGSLTAALRLAVDTGRPAIPCLAEFFHVQRHTIRFLAGKTPREIGRRWSAAPGRLITLLDRLPPDLRPRDAPAWRRIECLVAAAEDHTLRPASPPLIRSALVYWQRKDRKEPWTDSQLEVFSREAMHVTEYWAALEDCLLTRAATTHRSDPAPSRRTLRALADSLVSDRGWAGLLAQASAWRAALVPAQAAVQSAQERLLGKRFAPLLPEVLIIGARLLVPLETPGDLDEEGAVLGHCVGSYAATCVAGDSYLVSIRARDSKHALSTAEFRIARDRPGQVRLTLRQHRGLGNREPSPECVAAVDALLSSANMPTLQRHWGQLMAECHQRHTYAEASIKRIAAILALEHAFRAVLRSHGGYQALIDQLLTPDGSCPT